MIQEILHLRIGLAYIKIYKGLYTYTASLSGTLPFPNSSSDLIEEESLLDLILILTINYCEGGMLPIEQHDKTTNKWLKW